MMQHKIITTKPLAYTNQPQRQLLLLLNHTYINYTVKQTRIIKQNSSHAH